MSKRRYNKPPLTYLQLVQQLKDRGLTITNEAKAQHLLKNISYYRFSGYWYPLLRDKNNLIFKPPVLPKPELSYYQRS
jgi:abortive infection bacteriophage resistance protein